MWAQRRESKSRKSSSPFFKYWQLWANNTTATEIPDDTISVDVMMIPNNNFKN